MNQKHFMYLHNICQNDLSNNMSGGLTVPPILRQPSNERNTNNGLKNYRFYCCDFTSEL